MLTLEQAVVILNWLGIPEASSDDAFAHQIAVGLLDNVARMNTALKLDVRRSGGTPALRSDIGPSAAVGPTATTQTAKQRALSYVGGSVGGGVNDRRRSS